MGFGGTAEHRNVRAQRCDTIVECAKWETLAIHGIEKRVCLSDKWDISVERFATVFQPRFARALG